MANKKSISILFITIFFVCLSFCLLIDFVHKRKEKKTVYQSIPSFSLSDIEDQTITEKSLQKHTPTLFVFFNPECELCHEELKQINLYQEAFSHFQIVFFSTLPSASIHAFLEEIAFNQTPNSFFLVDEKEELVNTMEIQGPPTSIIYDKNGKLIKRFNGVVKVETLIKYLSQ